MLETGAKYKQYSSIRSIPQHRWCLQNGWKTWEIKFELWAEASRFGSQILHHTTIDHQVLSWKNCTLRKCVICRHLRGRLCQQKTVDLPRERLYQESPFTYCGIDIFGTIFVKEDCKKMKRYGCLFTCLSSKAICIESTNSLSTDAFIEALRRFVSRKGNVRLIRTDNGTNFVAASAELDKAFSEINYKKINEFMLEHGGQLIHRKRNPPTACNMGGVWEHQMRFARSILVTLLKVHGISLNDESLRIFLAEAEAFVNTRPITSKSLSDVDSPVPLCHMQLLTMKSRVVMPPLGEFQKKDIETVK